MKIKPILFALLLGVILSSCSLVKDQTASNNFRRVKYNAHLKLCNSVEKKQLTVNSFETNESVRTKLETRDKKLETEEKKHEERVENQNSQITNLQSEINNQKSITQEDLLASEKSINSQAVSNQQQILQKAVELTKNLSVKNTVTADDWWESDPEDWPWKEIILALIAFLLIALIVFLLVDLLGGVAGGIIGLILLLLLLYFLIEYLS